MSTYSVYSMKKRFYLQKINKLVFFISCLGSLLLLPVGLSAQEEQADSKKIFSYGIKVGSTISSFSQEQPHSNKIIGLSVGLYSNCSLSQKIALQLEVNYNLEGGRLLSFEIPENTGMQTWYTTKVENKKLRLHNLNIPLLFRYNIKFQNYKLYTVIGPNIGINLKSDVDNIGVIFPNNAGFVPYNQNSKISSKIENLSYSISGGIGLEIPLNNNKHLIFDTRLRYGLSKIYKGYSYIKLLQDSDHLRNSSLTVSIGYGF